MDGVGWLRGTRISERADHGAAGGQLDDVIDLNGRSASEGQPLIHNTAVTCALAAPPLTVPAGLTDAGLPVGLELISASGGDRESLGLGIAIQRVLGRLAPPKTAG